MMTYSGENFSYTYYTYGDRISRKQTILMIPPGPGNAMHFSKLAKALANEFNVITVSLPGTDNTVSNSSTVASIARELSSLIKELKVSNPIILGESYGGSVAVELTNLLSVKKLILIGSGEYFKPWQRVLLKLLFWPTRKSTILVHAYAKLLTVLKINDFSGYSTSQLQQIRKRWESLLFYSLPQRISSSTTLVLFYGQKDRILQKESLNKLCAIFPNNSLIALSCGHMEYSSFLSAELVRKELIG